jgi:RNA-dependent RNA polymerase
MSLEIKPGKDLIQLFSSFVQAPEHKQQFSVILTQSELLRQRKVFVTPTLIKYSTASEEESNRVIRKFKGQISNFIRLCFVNENMDKGYYFNQEETNNNFILGYIFRIVSEGFSLSNLQFKFLAYSNSQLKAHSAWFLCANNPHDPIKESQIASFMGNFDKETNVLKKYARKGQCFSTSTYICTLKESQVTLGIKDVKRNGFCFSDGVGYISPDLANVAARKLGYTSASAFQIRLAGAKGVLMQNPSLSGYQVQLRESQIKFEAADLSLNIIRASTFGQGYLNRQVIQLLYCLGVPEHYFVRLQN